MNLTLSTPVEPHDWQAIHDLVVAHAWTLDHGDPRDLADHYTEDGVLIGLEKPLEGRSALRAWGEWRAGVVDRTSRHVHTNIRLTRHDGEHRGVVTTLLYRHEGDGLGGTVPLLVSDYLDTYRRVEGRWLIARREMRRVFADSARIGGPR